MTERKRKGGDGRRLGARRERFLFATAEPGFAGADPAALLGRLGDPGPVVVHRTRPGGRGFPDVAVLELEADRAAILSAHPLVHLEPDLPLRYAAVSDTALRDPGLAPLGEDLAVPVLVRDSAGAPVAGAEVYLISPAFPARGLTGADGAATLAVPRAALAEVRGLYVRPQRDHWAVWLAHPDLDPDQPAVVVVPALGELDGWARRAMRFDALPPTFRGHGVRIAIIDSGAAAGHPDLSGRVTAGWDLAGGDGWRVDTVGHGSHAAGIIGGSDNGTGIIGVVPEAELHSCRIFPDGRLGDLIEALDYCLAAGVDVVNLSLGSAQPSALVARKIEQLRQAGVACVAAAGDTGGPVAFPASLPTVLAVAAIGRTGEYPPESYHATQVSGAPTAAGYFSARFTGHGPEVDVCAPGVAVISSVPPAGYAAWDGTACAAPYVTGLAALLLAHHPDFRERYASRDAARVDRLFALIRSTCQPLALGDPGEHSRSRGWAQASTPNVDRGRTGAGLPDAEAALGLKPPVTLIPPADPTMAALWTALAHAGLVSTPVPVTTPAAATPRGPDVLAPLRAALRAAGLLAYQPASE